MVSDPPGKHPQVHSYNRCSEVNLNCSDVRDVSLFLHPRGRCSLNPKACVSTVLLSLRPCSEPTNDLYVSESGWSPEGPTLDLKLYP